MNEDPTPEFIKQKLDFEKKNKENFIVYLKNYLEYYLVLHSHINLHSKISIQLQFDFDFDFDIIMSVDYYNSIKQNLNIWGWNLIGIGKCTYYYINIEPLDNINDYPTPYKIEEKRKEKEENMKIYLAF